MKDITIICQENGFRESVNLQELNRTNPTFDDLEFYLGGKFNAIRNLVRAGVKFAYINPSGVMQEISASEKLNNFGEKAKYTFYMQFDNVQDNRIVQSSQTITGISFGSFTDQRDNRIYKTVSFEDTFTGAPAVWFAENLDFKLSENCMAYENVERYRQRLGLLYTWDDAKKACPPGWHLSTDSEWKSLENYFGGIDKAGKVLKSKQAWGENDNGDNSSGFNMFPAGFRSGSEFRQIGNETRFWTNTKSDNSNARIRMLSNGIRVIPSSNNFSYAFSVRCIKD